MPRSRGLLLAVVATAVVGGLLHPHPFWQPAPVLPAGEAGVDVGLYTAVVEGLRAGGDYYEVLGAELRGREFPRRPLFNWRTPLHLSLLAWLPSLKAAVGLYLALALAAVAPAVPVLRRQGLPALVAGLFVLIVAVVPMAQPKGVVFAEVWAGAALLLAFTLRLHGRFLPAALAALLALFFRELAAPFVVVLALVDLRGRRWPVVGLWAAGAAAYALYFGLHAVRVQAHLLPGVDDHVRSWVGIGGPSFVLQTLAFFAPVALLPRLAPAVAVLALVAAVGTRVDHTTGLRVAVPVWLGFLLVFGQPFNIYWGCVGVPAVALALALAPPVVRKLACGAGR